MAKQRTKNQHYVPQFYLRHFADSREKLHGFDKPKRKSFPTEVDEIASTKYFYEIDPKLLPPGTPFQVVEKTLCDIEGASAKPYEELLAAFDRDEPVTDSQKTFLASMIALQRVRTQEFRASFQEMIQRSSDALRSKVAPGSVAEKQLGSFADHVDEQVLRLDHAKLMFGQLPRDLAAVMSAHIWFVGRTPPEKPLYTSDAPLAKHAHVQSSFMGTNGIGSPGIELTFPLSSKYLLVMLERSYHGDKSGLDRLVVEFPAEMIDYYNAMQMIESRRQVYCVKEDFAVAEQMLRDNPHLGDTDRQRVQVN